MNFTRKGMVALLGFTYGIGFLTAIISKADLWMCLVSVITFILTVSILLHYFIKEGLEE